LFPSSHRKVSVHTAAGSGAIDQKLRERRLVIRKTARGALTCRIERRRTRTAKLLNSNSFIGTNSRLGSSKELVKNFIIIFKLRFISHLKLRCRVIGPPLLLRSICSYLLRGSAPSVLFRPNGESCCINTARKKKISGSGVGQAKSSSFREEAGGPECHSL